ncbi:exosortase [Rhodanobacter thiooxydans]|uniref:Exosortase n=1 Tax=Rhodanobacter thiooxydans TaxID=416169 RepID=A0A154QDH3_9GAMM|nr:EpsI domain-containing exosortase [Rhodanobacter thiooxydans]EIM02178.1 exosortase 1 [Rhodanobacter thiooxydans LCS2]KZC22023.1 exosortase [Rhodanobacter thiooxydans]MCW0200490.1 EpsI domain-containing exosortase [Rhodanobacter thiooxydans]
MNRPFAAVAGFSVRTPDWVLAAAAFAVAVVVLLVCYWRTVQSLVWAWAHDGTYQYAFLIFPLSLWVASGLRHQLQASEPVPSIWGLAAVTALVFVWYAGRLLDVNLAQHFAFVALFPALVLACWGWQALWVLAFPLGYLVVFAVPWGDALVGPLQDITAHFAVRALELTGTPVLLNGREIITPSAVWMVADACSGVKFFIACTALGCLYAYLMYRRWWKRVVFVALAAVVPVVANGLRVYFTVLIGETWGPEYATGTDHLIFGWQFFGTVLLLLLLVGWFFRDPPVMSEHSLARGNMPATARTMVWPAAVALLIAGPALAVGLAAPVPPETVQLTAPTIAGWNGPQAAADGWRPIFRGAAGQVRVSYQSAASGDVVELFHAIYTGKPRRGHTLITYGNDLYDPARAQILSRTRRQLDLASGWSTTAAELRLAGASGSRLVWYWYCVDRHCTRSPVLAKLLQAWAVLRGQLPRSSVWALSSPVGGDDADRVRTKLHVFAQALPVPGTPEVQAQQSPDLAGSQP